MVIRSVCKVQGKNCNVVIESDSTDNLVSIGVGEKLNLKNKKNATSYKVSWLQKGHQILMNEKFGVELQIGRYKDNILCDVRPMDMCNFFFWVGHGILTE